MIGQWLPGVPHQQHTLYGFLSDWWQTLCWLAIELLNCANVVNSRSMGLFPSVKYGSTVFFTLELLVLLLYFVCPVDLHLVGFSGVHLLSPVHWFPGVISHFFPHISCELSVCSIVPRVFLMSAMRLGPWIPLALPQLVFISRTLCHCYHCQDKNIILFTLNALTHYFPLSVSLTFSFYIIIWLTNEPIRLLPVSFPPMKPSARN